LSVLKPGWRLVEFMALVLALVLVHKAGQW
jgi:hypothetical protein